MPDQGAKRVLWLSQHSPDAGKIRELARVLGAECVLTVEDMHFRAGSGAVDIASRFRAGGFGELVLVAPTGILADLVQMGINPLWPKMSNDRRTFLGYERILEIRRTREDVQPDATSTGRKVLWASRFAPSARQATELRRLFGEDVVINHRALVNDREVEREFENGRYDAVVAIVPEAVFERLTALELPLIRAESVEESDPSKVEYPGRGGRGFRFDRYVWYRIERVTQRL